MTDFIKSGFTEFIKHIKSGNVNDAKLTFKEEYLEMEEKKGLRSIHYACRCGNIEVVQFLLKLDCNCEASDDWGLRPLHYACRHRHIEIVQLLLQHKCDIEASDNYQMRSIHHVCATGYVEIVELLVEHRCNINVSDQRGKTPIHYACLNGNIKIVKLLLQHQCNIEECYNDLVNIANTRKSQELIDLLTAFKKNKSMCCIAMAMSLECESGCSHRSCFISKSIDNLMKGGELIGSGTFGDIYHLTRFEKTFAMKIIRINDERKNIEKDLVEHKNILKHENIVQYFGVITESNQIAIFMEYMAGESLQNQIRNKGSLPHNIIAKYSRQIILGVAYLHQNKILHRDIKPANILLDSGGELLKLCDFGISRSLMTVSAGSSQKASTGCGTPNYMAPEVIKEKPYSYPVDIWSIGATMVEMLTGRPPFDGMHQYTVIIKISQLQTFEFTPVQPMTDQLKSFVYRMLQCEPSKRATAKQLLKCEFINTDNANHNFDSQNEMPK